MDAIFDTSHFRGSMGDALSDTLGTLVSLKKTAVARTSVDGDAFTPTDSDGRQKGVERNDAITNLTLLSSSPNSVCTCLETALPPPPSIGGGPADLVKVGQGIHTISGFGSSKKNQDPIDSKSSKNNSSNASKTAEGCSSLSTVNAVPSHCLRTSNECRPSHRQYSHGMPLRPCLQPSTKSLPTENESIHLGCRSDKSAKRNVSFSSLEIRSYGVTLGDAPTARGPPVSLGWDYDAGGIREYDVDHYETYRAAEAPRRSVAELSISPMDRYWLLVNEAGCRRDEIQRAMNDAKRVLRQRERTRKGVKLRFVPPMEEVLEKATRRLSFGKKSDLKP